jgi:UDP-3-O-[3-hydroxymyristoyl] glucosamine N-acyltransferase
VLYADVVLGDRVEVHAGTVVGGDGFKYHMVDGRHVKVPHTGGVEIGDDVEIGSNCTIDRATFETTRIGEGTKVDNLVMIGHNNQIGRHNLLCGQVGIAGSCKTGDYVVMAGQAGIKDHTEIGDKVMVGAQAGVHRNIPAGQNVLGSPAIPLREQRRIFQMIARLPDMHRHLREMAAQLALLTAAAPPAPEAGADDDPTGF